MHKTEFASHNLVHKTEFVSHNLVHKSEFASHNLVHKTEFVSHNLVHKTEFVDNNLKWQWNLMINFEGNYTPYYTHYTPFTHPPEKNAHACLARMVLPRVLRKVGFGGQRC